MVDYAGDEIKEVLNKFKSNQNWVAHDIAEYVFKGGGQKVVFQNRLKNLNFNDLDKFKQNFITAWRTGAADADIHLSRLTDEQKTRFAEVSTFLDTQMGERITTDQKQEQQRRQSPRQDVPTPPPSPKLTHSFDEAKKREPNPDIIDKNAKIIAEIEKRYVDVRSEFGIFHPNKTERLGALTAIKAFINDPNNGYKNANKIIDLRDIEQKIAIGLDKGTIKVEGKRFKGFNREKFEIGTNDWSALDVKNPSDYFEMKQRCIKIATGTAPKESQTLKK